MAYQPIEDYGIIGNLRTAALVGKNGSIDWLCFPRFDSPSIFGAILDDQKGGFYRICPDIDEVTCKQLYWPDTNILVTRFLSADGAGEVIDFMPVRSAGDGEDDGGLIRQVRVLRGSMRFRLECRPGFNYARDAHSTRIANGTAYFSGAGLHFCLKSAVPLRHSGEGVSATFALNEGRSRSFVFYESGEAGQRRGHRRYEADSDESFNRTVAFWRGWMSRSTYRGRWREMVNRSALVLKLLTYEPTGAIVAAPTCSLPEGLGGGRNWDYRYTWIRDAAFTVYSLMRLGYTEEAMQFASFLDARCHELGRNGSLQTVYGIGGERTLKETTLDHLDGYMASRPVRIGNAAYLQLQLDIYGELMDSGRTCGGSRIGFASIGATRTRPSGKCGAGGGISCIRKSCAGWRWIEPFAWRRGGRFPRTGGGG